MGAAVSDAFASSGYSVAVWNRTFEHAEALAGDRITPVRPVADEVSSSELIVACSTSYDNTLSALTPGESTGRHVGQPRERHAGRGRGARALDR
jgi:3-hydroxyisobutyrate dehydrogenase-like beta-hydroxyacid dehydrogenase